MRRYLVPLLAGVALIGLATFAPTGAQEPAAKPKAAEPDPTAGRIVPVVAVKPGESKEMLLSTSCALATRGAGLHVRDPKASARPDRDKAWTRDGVTVTFDTTPDNSPMTAVAGGVHLFLVKVTAAADAKPGRIDLHVADSTCSGTCLTDFRVLVLPK
ncbi:MAG TPA: hypothetical protein VKD90_11355 [Gemmataceae bacterium]|nr:hypothetical protein [Gemmataceae bacterium]